MGENENLGIQTNNPKMLVYQKLATTMLWLETTLSFMYNFIKLRPLDYTRTLIFVSEKSRSIKKQVINIAYIQL